MDKGELFADRFEVVKHAGSGGMGMVYKAHDRVSGQPVALKLLRARPDADDKRFQREATVLADLVHPAIVRHVAHGTASTGARYLAMEWLDGEDLGSRLAREGLSVRESLTLIRRVATGLAVAHARDIIHRDIKPSNLFLVGGDPLQTEILDFGIARPLIPTRPMTQTGAMVGTLGYVSPEQACGEREIDSRSDVFSLGCVLFECLTGRPAFEGNRLVAVLAKVLFGAMPHVSELRPELSGDLDEFVARLMSKEREQRPGDAAEVLAALDAVGPLASAPPPPAVHIEHALTTDEQRFLSIMLVTTEVDDVEEDPDVRPTLTPEQLELSLTPVRLAVEPLGGQMTPLANGTALIILQGGGTAKDLAARAAACALAVREAVPDARVALATGPVKTTGEWPVGQVIDRAATIQEAAMAQGADGVCIDDVTRALLDARFEVVSAGSVLTLEGDRSASRTRHLLGKSTPCVGRNKELAYLESIYEDCVEDPAASAVLVTGSAGLGKSRLAYELMRRIRSQNSSTRILVARGDPVYAGSPFSVASQLVRHATGLASGADEAEQHDALRAFLGAYFKGDDLTRVAEFLGELVGAPSRGEPSPLLLAARNEPRIKNEQLAQAFDEWLAALCSKKPVLLVLDDLQWSDQSSVAFIHRVLRGHGDNPLMVLALARPVVTEVFPRLWEDVDLQHIGLGGLKRRPAEKLVRAVLGDGIADATVRRTVEQANGNAFYLEELIRHIAERGTSDFPDSVLAMTQSRLEALDPEARRILRGASIFGNTFWEDAVLALLGSQMSAEDLGSWLDSLVDREILEPHSESKFPGRRELSFRHNLFREAAYAMLTEDDKVLGHRLAAEWLEQAGESDALVLAEHFENGRRQASAIPYLVRAAQVAFDGGDLTATLDIAARGLRSGATGRDRGALLLFDAGCALWRGEYVALGDKAREALELLQPGTTDWFMALAELAFAGTFGGDIGALMQTIQTLQGFRGKLPPIAPVGYSGQALHASLLFMGRPDEARRMRERLDEASEDGGTVADPVFLGYASLLHGWASLYGHEELKDAVSHFEKSMDCFLIARNLASICSTSYGLAAAYLVLGDLARSERLAREAVEQCRRAGVTIFENWSTWILAYALAFLGRTDESVATLTGLLERADGLLRVSVLEALATAQLQAGNLAEADEHARLAFGEASTFPIRIAETSAVMAAIDVGRGLPAEALTHAQRGLDIGARMGMHPFYESMARLARVEAHLALEQEEEGLAALREAQDRIEGLADSLGGPERRRRFIENHPANARTMELARQLLPQKVGG